MKKVKLLVSFMLVVVFAMCAFACEDAPKFNLNFEADGKVVHTVSTTGVEGVTMPTDPTKAGYTFDGWFFDKDTFAKPFTLEGLAATPIKADTTVYAKFTIIKVLTSIAVTTKPTKLEYRKGTDFDASGIVVTGTYDDGSLAVLTAANYSLDSTTFNKDIIGEYTITVKLTAKPTVTTTFTVSVIKSALSVDITTAATKTDFRVNEDFSVPGLVVEATFDDGSKEVLNATDYIIDSSDYNKALGGKYSIVIKVTKNTTVNTSYDVNVVKAFASIRVKTLPSDEFLNFPLQDDYKPGAITVEEVYDDGTASVIDSSKYTTSCPTFNKLKLGEYPVVVTLKGTIYTCTFNVNVVPPPFVTTYIMEASVPTGETMYVKHVEFRADGTWHYIASFGNGTTQGDYTFTKAVKGEQRVISIENINTTVVAGEGDYFVTYGGNLNHFKASTHEFTFGLYGYLKGIDSQVVLSINFLDLPGIPMGVIFLPDEKGCIPQAQLLALTSFGKVYLDEKCTTIVTDKTVFTKSTTVYIANIVDYTGLPFLGAYYSAADGETTTSIYVMFTADGKIKMTYQPSLPYTAIDNKDGTYTLSCFMGNFTYTVATKQLSTTSPMGNDFTYDKHNSSTHSIVTLVDADNNKSYYAVKIGTPFTALTGGNGQYTKYNLENYNNEPINADKTFTIKSKQGVSMQMSSERGFGNYKFSIALFNYSRNSSEIESYFMVDGQKYAITAEFVNIDEDDNLLLTLKSSLGNFTATVYGNNNNIKKISITSGESGKYAGDYYEDRSGDYNFFAGAPFVDNFSQAADGKGSLRFDTPGRVTINDENRFDLEVKTYIKTETGWKFTLTNEQTDGTEELIYNEANRSMTFRGTEYFARKFSQSPFINAFHYRGTQISIADNGRVYFVDNINDEIATVTISGNIYTITLVGGGVMTFDRSTNTLEYNNQTFKRNYNYFEQFSYYVNGAEKLEIDYYGYISINDVLIGEILTRNLSTNLCEVELLCY